MNVEELSRELAEGELRPAYLLAGEEPLLRDDALLALRRAVLAGGPEDFNHQRLGADATAGELRDAVATLPVMAEHRLVMLDDPSKGRRAGAKALADALADVVSDVTAQAQTVLVVVSAKPDRRSRWVKAFQSPAAVVDCQPPKGQRALLDFLRKEAKRQVLTLAPGAAELLAERVGPQLLVLRQELEKAALLAGAGEAITRHHVEAGSSLLAEQPIWDLTDAIGEGRIDTALVQLGRMQGAGAPAPVILGALASHFRRLARTRSGASVPGPPFVVRKLEGQARRYSLARLVSCLDAIHRTDTALKGAGALPPDLALERLVLGLAN
ncbi:MAG: DNA polymerase III subunit delta [Proteobacteria bacterium]|nr:DNA polymerase III subunit delta [Pseudomonadota bacterium]